MNTTKMAKKNSEAGEPESNSHKYVLIGPKVFFLIDSKITVVIDRTFFDDRQTISYVMLMTDDTGKAVV